MVALGVELVSRAPRETLEYSFQPALDRLDELPLHPGAPALSLTSHFEEDRPRSVEGKGTERGARQVDVLRIEGDVLNGDCRWQKRESLSLSPVRSSDGVQGVQSRWLQAISRFLKVTSAMEAIIAP